MEVDYNRCAYYSLKARSMRVSNPVTAQEFQRANLIMSKCRESVPAVQYLNDAAHFNIFYLVTPRLYVLLLSSKYCIPNAQALRTQ